MARKSDDNVFTESERALIASYVGVTQSQVEAIGWLAHWKAKSNEPAAVAASLVGEADTK